MVRSALPHEAVEGGLVVPRSAAGTFAQPGVELGLERIDVPAGKVVPDTLENAVRERAMAEERQRARGHRATRRRAWCVAWCHWFFRSGRVHLLSGDFASLHPQNRLAAKGLQAQVETWNVVPADDGLHLEFEAPVSSLRT